MAMSVERSCTMLVHYDKPGSATEIKDALEGNDSAAKVLAMQWAISMLLNGEQLPALFITIVRYVLPSDDHTLQKLLLLYLETIEKTDASGKLLPEMILICQNLRNNLQHPNEYIRGVTLRFLCRIREEEILEPLIPSILACLEHRHSYVRRNAVLAINSLYKLPKGELLLVDAPELIEKVLQTEQDLSTKRNAFQFLCNHAQDLAVNWLLGVADSVGQMGDLMQIAVLDLIRKVCRTNPGEKGKYIKIILALLQSTSAAVMYECAVTLVSLSQAPTAIRAAANCYCQLLVSHSDNNVRLIVLDRLQELKDKHREVMTEMLMDVLRALAAPNMDIRKKALDISLDLITQRNIDEVVQLLKKEVMKTQSKELEKGAEYRQLLVQAIHSCAVKFPDIAANVIHLLMDFLGDPYTASALDVIFFVREIMETNAKLREVILQRLLDSFPQIRSSRVCSCALWIIGEYCTSQADIVAAFEVIKAALGTLPFFRENEGEGEATDQLEEELAAPVIQPVSNRPAVLADGSYATQVAQPDTFTLPSAGLTPATPNLRTLLLSGDFFLGGVIAGALTKLVLRQRKAGGDPVQLNRSMAEAMLYITSILRLGESPVLAHPADADSVDRMTTCLQALVSADEEAVLVWLEGCRGSFSAMIHDKQKREAAEAKTKEAKSSAQPDELIDFHHLKARRGMSQLESRTRWPPICSARTGLVDVAGADSLRLNRVLQLTGLADPVYAEAYLTVHQYDIVLDVTVINRTKETLQNLCLELATMGDLKLVERPQNYTLGAGATKTIRANIKVSSTETGAIFGNIVYESTGYADRSVVVLNDIHIDILDYISPASCPDVQFRCMWAEFEWENKVAVNTTITDVNDFLDHIVASTNMRCLTPPSALAGDCGFMAANLYAKSVFGEDALVNVSVEKQGDGKLAGYIRIRSKTQGIALSLGDKLILKQKG
uniref:Coatomer subunit beta n=1 Tax=Botryococcus braunii TaxID=38881 RepID=Q76LD1_BOTBR|nr:coatomer subunit beta [Botryococcus braunii]